MSAAIKKIEIKQSVNGDYQKICKQVIAFEPRAEITIDTQFIKKTSKWVISFSS